MGSRSKFKESAAILLDEKKQASCRVGLDCVITYDLELADLTTRKPYSRNLT